MHRGISTEEALEQMRAEGASYLVGTPRGRLSQLEAQLFAQPWKQVQSQIGVKLARDVHLPSEPRKAAPRPT